MTTAPEPLEAEKSFTSQRLRRATTFKCNQSETLTLNPRRPPSTSAFD